ncbi:hypothetical protein Mapa_015961 [Marchantia paleacea]|nr:hypothetical protein Mapa_015961 [Marchantia paleacea]
MLGYSSFPVGCGHSFHFTWNSKWTSMSMYKLWKWKKFNVPRMWSHARNLGLICSVRVVLFIQVLSCESGHIYIYYLFIFVS